MQPDVVQTGAGHGESVGHIPLLACQQACARAAAEVLLHGHILRMSGQGVGPQEQVIGAPGIAAVVFQIGAVGIGSGVVQGGAAPFRDTGPLRLHAAGQDGQ